MEIDYDNIKAIFLEYTCVNISSFQWDDLMKGAVRANKKIIDRLVKEMLPDLYDDLALNYHNPYNYYRTKKHLVLVHSGVEYFIRFLY